MKKIRLVSAVLQFLGFQVFLDLKIRVLFFLILLLSICVSNFHILSLKKNLAFAIENGLFLCFEEYEKLMPLFGFVE